jgi:hypothetical protein
MALYREAIYREPLYRGARTEHGIDLNLVGRLDRFDITVRDRDGVVQHILTNKVGRGQVHSVSFDLLESGPGVCKFIVNDRLANASYDYQIEIRLYGTDRIWYAGYLDQIPDTQQRLGPYKYRAQGFFAQLNRTIIKSRSYEEQGIRTIIQDLMETVGARSGFEPQYNPAKISPNAFSVPQIKFKGVTLMKALQQLAEIAKNHRVGVDEYRDVFFYAQSFEVNSRLIFVEGSDYDEADITDDTSRLINKVYPKIGTVQSGSNLLDAVLDNDSIDQYGLREKVVDVPSVFTSGATATSLMDRWAEGYLREHSTPRKKGKIDDVKQKWDAPIKPEGKVRLFQLNGTTIEAFAKKVSYTIDDEFRIKITLGWPENALVQEFADINRLAEFNAAIAEMNAEQ